MDDDIAKLEADIALLDEEILKSATQFIRFNELMEEKVKKEQQLEALMDRWVYLNDLAERIAQNKKYTS